MRRIKKLFILIALLSNIIFAQELIWKHTGGPMGGIVGGMDISSNGDIYAGVYPFDVNYSGLYKSTNNGDSWEKIETQYEDFQVFSLYITQKDHIWVGTENAGALFRSTDNGETWNKANGHGAFECWAIGESNDGVLFAGDADAGRLYRSTNNGDNWEFSANLASLAFAADSNNIVYAGTFSGLYSTTDNGISWVQNNYLSSYVVSSVLVDSGNNIFCGTGYYNNGNGVFYSTDGGQNWTQIGLEGKVVLSLSFDSKENLFAGTLNDGLFKTSDLGQNWKQYQEGIYRKEIFRLKINQQDDIFIGSEGGGAGWLLYGGGGVFRLTNGGAEFEQVGLPVSLVKNIVFSGDSLIITATPSGVQKFNRFTKKWKNLGLHNVEAVTITPGDFLYAATREDGLYKSTDMGENWTLTNLTADTLMPVYNVLAVNNDTLFASTGFQMNLRRSMNGGENWDVLPIRTGETSRGLYFNNNILFITGFGSGTSILYKTNNFGTSIDSLYSGFDTQGVNNPLSATNNGYVLLASRGNSLNGIIRSTDDGQNWEQVLFNDKLATTVFANDDGIVITGTIVLSNSDTNKIYLSTNYGNTWLSTLQPTGWGISVTDIKQDPMNNFFFGTSAKGLYEIDIITDVEEEPFAIYNYSLSQNYPNPFNPSTTIKYQLSNSGIVTLKVYDILGREVTTLINEFKPEGSYEINFNTHNLSSGVYIYRITATNNGRILFSDSKQMILLK